MGIVNDTSRVEAREVEGTCGLELGDIEAEGVEEELLTGAATTVGAVVVQGHCGEVGIGELEVGHIGTVDLELELVVIVEDGEIGGIRGGEVLHGMVEAHLLDLVIGGDRLLDLGHDHVLRRTREHLTLLGIEVGVVRVDIPLISGSGRTPRDAELDVVVLEGDEGEGGLPVLTEGEAEGVEARGSYTTEEITSDRLGRGSRGDAGSDEGREGGILFINDLATDEKLHLGDLSAPRHVGVRLGRGTVVGDEVDIAEHVTLALEADGGHTVVRYVALNDLTLDSLREVRVTLVRRTEKADFGLTDEVHILSTDSDELGDTTRHFILYGEFIFKWGESLKDFPA